MEISKVGAKKILTEKLEKAESLEKSASTQEAKATKSLEENRMEISSEAELHCEALEMVRNSPEVRTDKIALLKAQIKEGTYEVDATRLAEKMIENHLENEIL